MLAQLGLAGLVAALPAAAAAAAWTECPGTTHIKAGDCNSPSEPCEPGCGASNAGVVASLAACEAKCAAARPVGNCAGVTWHDAGAGQWKNVCVLLSADAWAADSEHMAHHTSACNHLAPCSCAIAPPHPGPPPTPGPPPSDAAGCIVKQAAMTYSQRVLRPPRHADRIHAALGLDACANITKTLTLPPAPARERRLPAATPGTGAAEFFVDAAKGKDANAGTSAAPFATLSRAQAATRALPSTTRQGATVHLLGGATHTLNATLTLAQEDSGVSWVGVGDNVVVSGALSLTKTCGGKWAKDPTGKSAATR